MKLLNILLTVFLGLLISCQNSNTGEGGGSNDMENSSQSESTSSENDFDTSPCEELSLSQVSKVLGLDASQMSLKQGEMGGGIKNCTVNTRELSEEDEKVMVLYIDKMQSKENENLFEKQINRMIEQGEFTVPAGPDKDKAVSVREVEGIGTQAVVYSARNYTTLMYHVDNNVRYTVSLYRAIEGNPIWDGLSQPSEKLEEWAVEIAKML